MRMIVKLILVFCIACANAHAAGPGLKSSGGQSQAQPEVYRTVTPMSAEDETSVIVFFKYDCPVCRNYHAVLEHWGSTVPSPIIFQFFPVAEGDGKNAISPQSGLGIIGFWSSEISGNRAQRNMFTEEMYGLYQDRHVNITPGKVVEAAVSSGLSMKRFEAAWKKELASGSSHLSRQAFYKPTATPTMIICGKYLITPDNAMGNQETFIQLANGLLSKCLIEKGLAK